MTDAKSRYEIVNELTAQRQSLINEKSTLYDTIVNNEFQLDQEKRNNDREKQRHAQNIEDRTAQIKVKKKQCEERINSLDNKETALTEAIDAIKAISATHEKTK